MVALAGGVGGTCDTNDAGGSAGMSDVGDCEMRSGGKVGRCVGFEACAMLFPALSDSRDAHAAGTDESVLSAEYGYVEVLMVLWVCSWWCCVSGAGVEVSVEADSDALMDAAGEVELVLATSATYGVLVSTPGSCNVRIVVKMLAAAFSWLCWTNGAGVVVRRGCWECGSLRWCSCWALGIETNRSDSRGCWW